MDIKDCFNLGYIAKLHGFKGEVSLFLDVTDPNEYDNLKLVYLEVQQNELIPFIVQNLKMMNKGYATIQFKGIDSEIKAKELLKKSAYLPLTELPELDDKHFYDHEIIGFEVIDLEEGIVGKVIQVIDLPSNPLLQIENVGKEVLIPLIPGLVQNVDRKLNRLSIQAPPGLIELYK